MAGWYERENGRAIDFDVHVSSPVRTSFSVRFMLSDAHRRGLQVIADSGGFMLCSIGPAGKRPLIIFPIDRDKPLNILEPRQPAD